MESAFPGAMTASTKNAPGRDPDYAEAIRAFSDGLTTDHA